MYLFSSGVPGSNSPTSNTFQPSSSHTRPILDKDNIDKLRDVIIKTIEHLYARLCSAIGSEALPDLVKKLYEDGLIGKDLLTAPDYDNMMRSFFSTLDWDTSVEDLEKDCYRFIKALDRIGGPARKASERISSDIKKSVREMFGFDFKTP